MALSMKWHLSTCIKDYFVIEHTGRGMTNEERSLHSPRKASCSEFLGTNNTKGQATKDPHLDAEIEGNSKGNGDAVFEYYDTGLCRFSYYLAQMFELNSINFSQDFLTVSAAACLCICNNKA
jgi:hypothetical protein